MFKLYHFAIKRPRATLWLAAVVTFAAGVGISRLQLRTDGYALVPKHGPEWVLDRDIRATFNLRDPLIIVVQSLYPQGIYHTEVLQAVRELSAELAQWHEFDEDQLMSLATEHHFRHRPGTIRFRTLLESSLETTRAMETFKQDLRKIGFYHGTLVSQDEKATAIYLGVPQDANRRELLARVQGLIATRGNERILLNLIGAPVAEVMLGRQLLLDLGVPASFLGVSPIEGEGKGPMGVGLVVVALAVMGAVFGWVFRRFSAVALPIVEAGAAVVFTLGVLGWSGTPLYLTLTPLPVILITMGITDEIHIFHRYACLALGGEAGPEEWVRRTMMELQAPIVKTSLTTAVAFSSFGLSPLAPVRAFGIFTGIGILFCMVWSLSVIPAALVLWKPFAKKGPLKKVGHFGGEIAHWTLNRRKWAFGAVVFLAFGAAGGLLKLRIQDGWIAGFPENSGFRRQTQAFEAGFFGTHTLLVAIDGGHRVLHGDVPVADMEDRRFRLPSSLVKRADSLVGAWIHFSPPGEENNRGRTWSSFIETAVHTGGALEITTPRTGGSPLFWLRPEPESSLRFTIERQPFMMPQALQQISQLRSYILKAGDWGVGGVLAPTDYLETTGFMLRPQNPDSRRLPEQPKAVRDLWSRYRFIRGEARMRQLVDADYGRGVMAVFLKNANFRDTAELIGALRAYAAQHLEPRGMQLSFAGDVAVSQSLIQGIVSTQFRSLWLTLAGVLVIAALLNRSLRLGILVVIPCGTAVLINAGIMGWAGIPIGVASSMFGAMTLGLGVDFAIHLLERYRSARKSGTDPGPALENALLYTGPPILTNALALAMGFGVLVFSQTPANQSLGWLMAAGILSSAATTLLVLPTLLRWIFKSNRREP